MSRIPFQVSTGAGTMSTHALLSEFGRRNANTATLTVSRFLTRGARSESEGVYHHLNLKDHDHFLCIGTGDGEIIKRASERFDYGCLAGMDGSEEKLARACSVNRELIRNGRLVLKMGNSSELPFESESFTKVFAGLTWDLLADPAESLEEIYRVLKPDGCFVMGCNAYLTKPASRVYPMQVPFALEEVHPVLNSIGFVSIKESCDDNGKGKAWHIVARKPIF